MSDYSKTIRFRENRKEEQVALEALMNHKSYGYASANEMVIAALCKLTEPSKASLNYSPTELATLIANELRDVLPTITTAVASGSLPTHSEPETLEATEEASDDIMDDLMANIDLF